MKIRLIEPEPPGMHVWAKVLLPRLGLPIIAATLKAATGTTCSSTTPPWRPSTGTTSTRPTSSASRARRPRRRTAYGFADDLRGRGIPVVIGGSHVTFMADEALEHVDYVARGEGGEQLMLELIEALAGDRELDTIAGLSFKRDGARGAQPAARGAAPTSTSCRSPTCACSSAATSSRRCRS